MILNSFFSSLRVLRSKILKINFSLFSMNLKKTLAYHQLNVLIMLIFQPFTSTILSINLIEYDLYIYIKVSIKSIKVHIYQVQKIFQKFKFSSFLLRLLEYLKNQILSNIRVSYYFNKLLVTVNWHGIKIIS